MEDGRQIKITWELIHGILGIPMGDIKIIYVNSTISKTVKVEKTVPAFKAWNSKLLLKREQEEIELGGFGHLPIVEDLQVIETKNKKSFKKKNLIENRSITNVDATEDVLDKNEDFKSLDFEIALSFNPEDKELKKIIEERNNVFLDFFKVKDNNENLEGSEEMEGNNDKCEENEGNEEQQETYGESNEDESHNKAEHNESESIDNIGNLSLSAGQNTTVNAPVESIVNATVESTDNVVVVLPHIGVRAKESGTSDVATKKQVEVEKAKVLKEKRIVKPSSNFYDRRIKISEPLSEG
ncbi:hypothetical protein Tco_0134937 [Tanacetum coccineum]